MRRAKALHNQGKRMERKPVLQKLVSCLAHAARKKWTDLHGVCSAHIFSFVSGILDRLLSWFGKFC